MINSVQKMQDYENQGNLDVTNMEMRRHMKKNNMSMLPRKFK